LERASVHALLIDDDQGDYEFTRALMSQIEQYDITLDWVATYEEGVDSLSDHDYDVFFVDYFLEDRSGLDLLREARRRGVKTPMIMLTGRGSHDVDVEAMHSGASDYLVKGEIEPDNVERCIRYALDRAEQQAALLESEEKHRSMFDHLPIGLYRCSPEGEFMDANPALVRILGHPDAEKLEKGYAVNFYLNPNDVEAFKVQLQQFGVVRGFPSKLRRSDGSPVRVRNTARTHRDPNGDITYVEGAVEDVSEALQAGGVERQAARYDRLLESLSSGLIFADVGGRILGANPAIREDLGYEDDALEGSDLAALFAEEDREALGREIESLVAGRTRESEGHRRLLTDDGEVLWGRVRMTTVSDLDGQPEELLVLIEELGDS